MAEKKKGKKRKEEYIPPGEEVIEKPSKEEYGIAKWLRKNVPIKKTKFLNHNVEYFTASKALDALMLSKYATSDSPLFASRQDVVDYLDMMLRHKFFHRARKVPVSEQELKARKKEKKSKEPLTDNEEKKKEEKEKGTDAESSHVEGRQETAQEKEKRKRKVRLEMHAEQVFVDGLDAYVWIYDPIPVYYWFFGTLLVLGAIGICLFPLWPPSVRKGVYYISVAAAGFLVFIIALAVLRVIVFCLVWMITFGKHHIWLLPNLTEDVGFLASFWPLYKYEYKGDNSDDKKDKKKKKKDKDSDAENEDDTKSLDKEIPKHEKRKQMDEGEVITESSSQTSSVETVPLVSEAGGAEAEGTPPEEGGGSESDESSQRSSTGRDFEMVDQDELVDS